MSLFNNSSGLAGFIAAGMANSINRKTLVSIQKENEERQGILKYEPSDVEAFFDEKSSIENMMFSGGDNIFRVRSIIRAVECAYLQGYSVLILHIHNTALENNLDSYFGTGITNFVNGNNPIYDPFMGASNEEISKLVISSSTSNSKINPVGRYYINGISDYIKANKKNPRCYMFINCPHLTLLDDISKAETQGRITHEEARRVITQIMQGEIERGNIETFFETLARQGINILSKKTTMNSSINFANAVKQKSILSIDVQSGLNTILINMLLNEAETIISQGGKVMIVVDGIQFCSSDVMMDLIKRSGRNFSIVTSAEDVYSGFGGNDNDFFSFTGKCSKIIISKHTSAHSCQKYSDIIGVYDKREISNTYAQNVNYVNNWGYGRTQTASVSIKRENRVKPEEIQGLKDNEVIIIDKDTGEISFVPIS